MIIADTGFWVALANKTDRYHDIAKDALENLQEPLISTWPVVTETCYFLLSRLGSHAQQHFLESYRAGAFHLFDLKKADMERIILLQEKYQDLPMDLADASLVVLAEHLGEGKILSTDQRDFQTYRWKSQKPFKNLLTLF